MNNIVLLFVCLLLGMGLRAAKKVPENAHLALNAFIIHISLPALIILQIHNVKLHTSLLFSIAMPWLMFALGVWFFLGAFCTFEIFAGNHRRADAGWRTGQHIFRGPAHD